MEEDEFGDLYDDVAVQDSSAITKLAAPVSSPVTESDSEDDDLHIVLNEEVGAGASNGKCVCRREDADAWDGSGPGGSDPVGERAVCGGSSGFHILKCGWPYSVSFPGNANAKWVVGSMPCASSSVYWGDKELNWWGQGSAVGRSVAPYCGGFWLPRSRTILDVNIDAFEEKRWRSPRADVSDFFNFGLNEDAWKEYCSSLDQSRQWSYTRRQSSIPVHTSSKPPQPNGQAIQIEESAFERQPTMDLSQPRMSDSDVIIEIKVQDCDDNCCDVFKESDHLERTKLGLLEDKDVGLSHDKDDKLVGFLELDDESRDRKYFSHDEDSRYGADACYLRKMKDQISMNGSEAVGSVEKTEEEAVVNMHDASQDLVDTDSSISGKIQFSSTVSCSGSETESSIDGFCNIPEESPCHPRKINIQANLRESVASDGESPKSVSAIRESSCVRRYASDENSTRELHKQQTDRVQRRISPNSYNDASAKSVQRSKSPSRRCKLSEELPTSRKHYDSHHTDRVQRKISPDHYNDAPRKSMHRSMSPARLCKLNEELLASSNHCREYFSYRTRRDDYYDYGKQGLSVKHCDDIYANQPQRRLHGRFEDEMKLCGSAHLDEEIFYGRRHGLKNQDARDRYWYNGEGRLEPAYSPRPTGKSDRFKARDIQLNWFYGSQIIKNGDSPLLDHEIWNNLGKEKYRGLIRSRHRNDFVAGSQCREMEDERDPHYLTSWSHGESKISSKQWLQGRLSPRSDMYDSRLSSGFSDHRRQVIEDDTVYLDDGGSLKMRKYGHQLNTWSDAHDELGAEWHDVPYFEKEGTKSLRHQKIYASRFSNELQFEHPRDEMIRRHISTECANMYRNSMYRYDHDHTVRRSSDPVDVIVGKRKTSETDSQGWKFDGKKRRQSGRNQADIQMTQGKKNKSKRKWLQEDAELNNVSDIEEGQIITEDYAKGSQNNLTASVQQAGRALPPHPQQGTGSAYDDRQISEAMARMERRRERFKEPLATSKSYPIRLSRVSTRIM